MTLDELLTEAIEQINAASTTGYDDLPTMLWKVEAAISVLTDCRDMLTDALRVVPAQRAEIEDTELFESRGQAPWNRNQSEEIVADWPA